MNTGHDGSLSTGHSNSCFDMLSRLETMVLMAENLPLLAMIKGVRHVYRSNLEKIVIFNKIWYSITKIKV